jgi:glycosyltransferase involved in cell wall biosynthesis
MKKALVYDWLVTNGGGERTFEAIHEVFPEPIYTLFTDQRWLESSSFKDVKVHTSFLQKVPHISRCYRYLLPLFPLAIEGWNLKEYDVVLSVSHAVAKGVLTLPHQLHICYCFTPMRYAWDLSRSYVEPLPFVQKVLARRVLHKMRKWDVSSLHQVDHFFANSQYVAQRIERIYGRKAEVIYPPVEVDRFEAGRQRESYYLTVSRLVPYKRVELIVEAFAHMPDKKLVVVGDGPKRGRITEKACANVEILGAVSDEEVCHLMQRAKGFIFAAEEDFGIVAVEAQAAGAPVIAFGKGGALETVVDQKSGLFFQEQTVASLIEAVHRFERLEWDPAAVRENALRFSKPRFQKEFKEKIHNRIEEWHEGHHLSRR